MERDASPCGRADAGTRERILQAATALFAARGYRATTVRRITERAKANVAAVHYHFGGKEGLYLTLLREKASAIRTLRLEAIRGRPDLESALRSFVESFFSGHEEGAEEMELFFREMVSPGPGFDILTKELIAPIWVEFSELLLREAPGMTPERARFCLASLIGQLAHFVRVRRGFPALFGREYDDDALKDITEHVVRFSLWGILGKGDSQ